MGAEVRRVGQAPAPVRSVGAQVRGAQEPGDRTDDVAALEGAVRAVLDGGGDGLVRGVRRLSEVVPSPLRLVGEQVRQSQVRIAPFLVCGPLDHHTLGLEAIAALLRLRRWDCRMLGARTPADSLARAVTETDAIAVVLVSHLAAGRPAAIETLRAPELSLRHLFYAGGAFGSSRARRNVPGHYLGTNIAKAAELITDTLTSASS